MKPNIRISISKSKFNKEAILATCCEMASEQSSFLLGKTDDNKFIEVLGTIESTQEEADLREVAGDFRAILYEKQLQIDVMKNNMKTVEDLVYNALSNPEIFKPKEQEHQPLPESIAKIIQDTSNKEEESYLDDILQIAVPWEEKNQE